jgi:hypothetical protein
MEAGTVPIRDRGSFVAANTVTVVVTFAVFLGWVRYVCLQILRNHAGRNYAGQIASANHLMFMRAQAMLGGDDYRSETTTGEDIAAPSLDRIERSLDRDYRVLTYLIRNAAEYCGFRPERVVLTVDFHLMKVCYRILRGISTRMARSVVLEMALIVNHLARYAGEALVDRKG